MIIKVFRYYWETIHEYPKDFTLAYYDPSIKAFADYACTFIANNNDSYELKGPDEKLKKEIDEQFKNYGFHLISEHSEEKEFEGGSMVLLMPTIVKFLDPLFPDTFNDLVAFIALGEDYYYTSEVVDDDEVDGYKKVNSVADIKRLDREYAIKEAREGLQKMIEEKKNKKQSD